MFDTISGGCINPEPITQKASAASAAANAAFCSKAYALHSHLQLSSIPLISCQCFPNLRFGATSPQSPTCRPSSRACAPHLQPLAFIAMSNPISLTQTEFPCPATPLQTARHQEHTLPIIPLNAVASAASRPKLKRATFQSCSPRKRQTYHLFLITVTFVIFSVLSFPLRLSSHSPHQTYSHLLPPLSQGLVCSSVFIFRHPHTQAAEKAFVTFTSRSDLLAALTMDGCYVDRRNITVSSARVLTSTPFTQATLGCIIILRSAVIRSHLHVFNHTHAFNFGLCTKPCGILTSGQTALSKHERLRLLACSGIHSKVCSQLFAPASMARAACTSFASFVLRRVVAKLAAATPEVEAAHIVSWCKKAAQDELHGEEEDYYIRKRNRRQTEYAADAMLQLAASANGLLALVSCGACETLVDLMLQNKVYSVHGCLKEARQGSYCQRNKCTCTELSCRFHRCYVCAALVLGGCAAGAYRLNCAGWNPNWQVVVGDEQEWVDEKLKHQTLMIPPVVVHFEPYFTERAVLFGGYARGCHCELLESLCPLEDPALLQLLNTTPGYEQTTDEKDEMASNVTSSCFE